MHAIELNDLNDNKALTQAILQITQMLGMYQAELARVLGVQCSDIGALASAKRVLDSGTPEWQKARQFVVLYAYMHRHFAGDAVAMYHWLHAPHAQLTGTPLLLMVDEGRLADVLAWFETQTARHASYGGKINT